jgi:predicted nucleotidyltransferase
MHIEDRHWQIVKSILSKYNYSFYAFGSRVKGNPQKFSDLDLCYFGKIPNNELFSLEEDFEESDLPYKVDIISWDKINSSFRELIKKDLVCIQENKTRK